MIFRKLLTGAFAATTLSAIAAAHTPYLAPSSFDPVFGKMVTLDAAFAEKFFVPEAAFAGSDFKVINPNGVAVAPETLSTLKTRVVIEHSLEDKGTYKFSTGHRTGKIFRIYEKDGKRHVMEKPGDALPEGAKELSFFQAITLAETYVTKGAPDTGAIKAWGKGLEIKPETHPNEIYAGESFDFTVDFEGEAIADQQLDIFTAQGEFSPKDAIAKVTTDAAGAASFTPTDPGVYLVRARHRAPAPDGAAAPVYSYTYTLVLEAAR